MTNLINLLTRVLAAVVLVAGVYLAGGFMNSVIGTGDAQATAAPCDGGKCYDRACGVYGDDNLCGVCAIFPGNDGETFCGYMEVDVDGDGILNSICVLLNCGR